MMGKRLLCLDFDGVIHAYTSGWQGPDVIPDPPVPGALAFLREALNHFTIAIYSSRSHEPGGLQAMRDWLSEWSAREFPRDTDLTFLAQIKWPVEKPPAFLTLDDRALTFTGEWPAIETLKAFQPWYKRPPERAADGEKST